MRHLIPLLLSLAAACGGGTGDDGPPPDAAGGRCSAVCSGDTANCGFDGLDCRCSGAGGVACGLDSCDARNDALPYCSAPGVCTTTAPWCTFDGACQCGGDGPEPVDCRTDYCEAP